jgi:hypothetical protein
MCGVVSPFSSDGTDGATLRRRRPEKSPKKRAYVRTQCVKNHSETVIQMRKLRGENAN